MFIKNILALEILFLNLVIFMNYEFFRMSWGGNIHGKFSNQGQINGSADLHAIIIPATHSSVGSHLQLWIKHSISCCSNEHTQLHSSRGCRLSVFAWLWKHSYERSLGYILPDTFLLLQSYWITVQVMGSHIFLYSPLASSTFLVISLYSILYLLPFLVIFCSPNFAHSLSKFVETLVMVFECPISKSKQVGIASCVVAKSTQNSREFHGTLHVESYVL